MGRQDAEEIAFSVDNPDQPLLADEYLDLPAKGGPADVWNAAPCATTWPIGVRGPRPTIRSPVLAARAHWSSRPGPRRYFQFRVDFQSDDLESAKILRQFSFDFTTPPLADVHVGEIFHAKCPRPPTFPLSMPYRAEMESGDLQGFDSFELVTGSRIDRIERIEIIDSQGESS